MPAPMTIVTLHDEDGDEFPFTLPGVYETNRAADCEAALQLAAEAIRNGSISPHGRLKVAYIAYRGNGHAA